MDEQIEQVCGKLLSSSPAGEPAVNSPNRQKLEYCKSADASQDAADADSAMWKVWSAVGVICTYACVASLVGGPTSEFLCMGANAAGGVTDAIVTKNFTSALMALGGIGVGYAVNQGINSGGDAAKKGPDKDIGACINAAMAGMQVFMKFNSMENNQAAAAANLASAKSVQGAEDTAVSNQSLAYQTPASAAPGASGGGTGSNTSGSGSGDSLAQGDGSSGNPCSNVRASGNNPVGNTSTSGAILQCAVASDTNLPKFVTDPKFAKEFQKDSGKTLASYLDNAKGSPSQTMASASGNGLSGSQATKIAAAFDGVSEYVNSQRGPGLYVGGGGGGGSDSGSGSDDMAGIMGSLAQGLADQMNPNKKKEEQKSGVSVVAFANQTRGPAAVVEDRKLSIFDRVSYRYHFVGAGLLGGGIVK